MNYRNIPVKRLREMAKKIHENAVAKGFWGEEIPLEERLALTTSELSEAMEADRAGRWIKNGTMICAALEINAPFNLRSFKKSVRGTVDEELIDAIIRVLDMMEAYNLPILNINQRFEWGKKTRFAVVIHNLTKAVTSIYEKTDARSFNFLLNALFSYAKFRRVNIFGVMEWKHTYNTTRPRLHGKKY